jgi:Tol biopolymer transport system component
MVPGCMITFHGGRRADARSSLRCGYVRGFEGHGTIWVMGADGSGQGQLTQGYDDTAPDWSADGEWLVFSRRGTLYTMRKDGEQVRSLQVEGLLPDWAPLPE